MHLPEFSMHGPVFQPGPKTPTPALIKQVHLPRTDDMTNPRYSWLQYLPLLFVPHLVSALTAFLTLSAMHLQGLRR